MYKREADKKIERVAEETGKSMAENSWPDAKVTLKIWKSVTATLSGLSHYSLR